MPSEKTPFQASGSAAPKNNLITRLFSFTERLVKSIVSLRGRVQSVTSDNVTDLMPYIALKSSARDRIRSRFEEELKKHTASMSDGFDHHFYKQCVNELAEQLISENPELKEKIVHIRSIYQKKASLF